jgi:hypothetical protein
MVGGESDMGWGQVCSCLGSSTVLSRWLIRGEFRNDADGTKKAGSLMNLHHSISDLVSFYPSLSFLE